MNRPCRFVLLDAGDDLNYSGIELDFSWSVWVFLLLCVAAVAFSFWLYKETIPPVPSFKKNVLAVFRSLSFVLALFILFEPTLDLTYRKQELPVIAVLIDRSESMGIIDKSLDRKLQVEEVMRNQAFSELSKNFIIEYFTFSDVLKPASAEQLDSLSFDGLQTDIALSLESLKRKMIGRNFAAAVLVTDGQYNLGTNPATVAAAYGFPIHTVGIGDPSESKDISIAQIAYNEVVYLDNQIPVDVSLVGFGYKGKSVSVQLKADDRVIQTKYTTVPEDGALMKVAFDFKAEKTGLQKYTVTVSSFPDELTTKNNTKSFFVKVLQSKLNVCLVSGTPGPDHAFLYKTLLENPDFQIKALVEKKDGSFIDVREPDAGHSSVDYDCYIFNNYPTANSNMSTFQTYVDAVEQHGKPFILFYGTQLDINKIQLLKKILPVEFKTDPALDESPVYPMLSVAGRNSVIMKVSDHSADAVQQWMELPPVWIGRTAAWPMEGSDILVRVDLSRATNVLKSRKDIPLIVSKKTDKNKSIAVMPYGFWKTYFVMHGLGKRNDAYTSFIENAVRWLTTKDDTKPVIITTSKNIYRNGEQILFSGQVYDEQYNPVNDAGLKVKVKTANRIYDVELSFAGNGRYEGSLNGLEVGDYEFEGEAVRQDAFLGRDRGKFAVENFSVELLNTVMNAKLLKTVASESGGRFFTPDNFSDIANDIKDQPVVVDERKEIEVWNKTLLLFILAGLLTLEWFIRKRSDML